MKIFLCPVSQDSLYAELLFSHIRRRYQPVFRETGGLPEAIACLERGDAVIVHIQWEEFFFRQCKSGDQADSMATTVERQIDRVLALGAPICWTVHNALPHKIPHIDQFLRIRRLLAACATRILVHNRASLDLLEQQAAGAIDADRFTLLPHPSYAGMYEPEGSAGAALDDEGAERAPGDRFVLGFGAMRKQKGFGDMIAALDPDFTASHGLRLRFTGHGDEGVLLQQITRERVDIDWDLGHMPADRVPSLMRGAACVLLPYSRVLTSGVAMLALTSGGIVVAPALPTFIELLPPALGRFLFRPDDPADLRRVVADVLSLDVEEARRYRQLGLQAMEDVHPALISEALGRIYDQERM